MSWTHTTFRVRSQEQPMQWGNPCQASPLKLRSEWAAFSKGVAWLGTTSSNRCSLPTKKDYSKKKRSSTLGTKISISLRTRKIWVTWATSSRLMTRRIFPHRRCRRSTRSRRFLLLAKTHIMNTNQMKSKGTPTTWRSVRLRRVNSLQVSATMSMRTTCSPSPLKSAWRSRKALSKPREFPSRLRTAAFFKYDIPLGLY